LGGEKSVRGKGHGTTHSGEKGGFSHGKGVRPKTEPRDLNLADVTGKSNGPSTALLPKTRKRMKIIGMGLAPLFLPGVRGRPRGGKKKGGAGGRTTHERKAYKMGGKTRGPQKTGKKKAKTAHYICKVGGGICRH